LDGDRLQSRLAAAQDRHDGGSPHEAGKRRDELITRPVNDRRAEDGPLERARAHALLRFPLGAVVPRARVRPGAERAHVQVALDARFMRHPQHVGGGQRMEALEGDAARPVLADDADEMDDGRASFDGRGESLGLEDVTGHPVDGFGSAQLRLGGPADETADEETVVQESAYHRMAHDAGAAGDAPGAVALVGQGDRVLYRKPIGSRALVPAVEPMTPDTIFDIASLTKPVVTAPAVMALVDAGKIDLDAPLGRYVKE